jgi:hypothetical protein
VKDYEAKKVALTSKITVCKDHDNPELKAMGEKLYWYSWSKQKALQGTGKSTEVIGAGTADQEQFQKFAKHFDARGDLPSSSTSTSAGGGDTAGKPGTVQIEAWKVKALALGKKVAATQAKAARLETKATSYVLRLCNLEEAHPLSKAHNEELAARGDVFYRARKAFTESEANTSSKTEAKSEQQAIAMHAALALIAAHMTSFEKVLNCCFQYLDMVE